MGDNMVMRRVVTTEILKNGAAFLVLPPQKTVENLNGNLETSCFPRLFLGFPKFPRK